jgi:hypothetical protein
MRGIGLLKKLAVIHGWHFNKISRMAKWRLRINLKFSTSAPSGRLPGGNLLRRRI